MTDNLLYNNYLPYENCAIQFVQQFQVSESLKSLVVPEKRVRTVHSEIELAGANFTETLDKFDLYCSIRELGKKKLLWNINNNKKLNAFICF